MTEPQPPQQHGEPEDGPVPAGADVLGDVLPAHHARGRGGRGRGRSTVLAAAVGAALAVTGAGVYAATQLSGGGTQPEDVLPADAMGFVKVDLDPAAGQKLNIYTLSKKFPDAAKELRSADSLRDDVLRLAFEDSDNGLDYDRDVKPWIGDRVGLAVVPSGDDEPKVVVAVAYTDRDKAEAGLKKAKAEADGDDPLEYALVDDYALLGDDAALIRRTVEREDHLSEEDAFTRGIEALGGDQVALAWADAARIWDALPAEVREQADGSPGTKGLDPTGQVVIGVHAERDAVEVVGKTLQLRSGIASQDALSSTPGTGLVGDLPDEAIGALSFGGLGKALTQGYDDLLAGLQALEPDLEEQAEELGFELPEDLATVLGEETAAAVWGDHEAPQFLVRTRTDDPDKAVDVLRKGFEASGGTDAGEDFGDYVREVAGGVAAGTPQALEEVRSGGLGERAEFRRAVPDADRAGMVLWVSLQDAFELGGLDDPDTEPLEAVGVTATGGSDAQFRLRVTFR